MCISPFFNKFSKLHPTGLLLVFLISAAPGFSQPSLNGDWQPEPQRAAKIANMVKQDCGSCHGLTLKGGLGPALTKQALAGKPSLMLVDTILLGRNNTAMPPWDRFLNKKEALWVVKQLKEGGFK